jgi:adenosylhomocysteinase
VKHSIKSMKLAEDGKRRIAWAARNMPVLEAIRRRFAKTKPLRGVNLSACLHVTTETANLAITLKAGGARLALCASNPLSTQDEVAASLVAHNRIEVFAVHGASTAEYYRHINGALDIGPDITMDDGADLVSTLHTKRRKLLEGVIGGTEETTTGVVRLRAMAADGALGYPVIAVNDSMTKHMFDNRYGTGQSTLDGIMRLTNHLFAGSTVVVAGYGWCGRGIASRAAGLGAKVIVTEVEPVRALEAAMDGYRVMPMLEAAPEGDLFITVTGDIDVVAPKHVRRMKSGAIVCNSGHFNVEIDLTGIKRMARSSRELRPMVREYAIGKTKKVVVLADGRLVNLSGAEGHPAIVMDMSFANQALAAEYLVKSARRLERDVYPVPEKIDREIAKLKLRSMGLTIDKLTPEQDQYLQQWREGT